MKCYGCFFLCFVIRVVYIEIVYFFDIDVFINVLCRLINFRGKLEIIYSDNGINFCVGEREI